MSRYIFQRAVQAIFVTFLVSVLVFLMVYMVPGDAVTVLAGPDPSPEVVEALRAKLGLDQPLPVQYFRWLMAALQGDLGASYIMGRPVAELIGQRLPATLLLAASAITVASVIGVIVGIVAALQQGRWIDTAITAINSFILSIPNFWFGIVGILIFSVTLRMLPSGGYKAFGDVGTAALAYLIMPTVTLSLDSIAMIARLVRASVLDELSRDYVTVARAKGVGPAWLMTRHISRNAAMPVLTVLGLRFGQMLGGAVLVESVFNWPGLGRLTVEAIKNRDVLVVQGSLLYFVIIFMGINLLIDLSYGFLNPRVRGSFGGQK